VPREPRTRARVCISVFTLSPIALYHWHVAFLAIFAAERMLSKNCWLTTSRNPPELNYEGAFRSWLARVLIDEAIAILRENRKLYVNSKQS